ncbi:hypothetical protein O6H91_21G033200 [Diphasiastrum complanatum]|uniref:Uncharacterized protein n=1 Tax=Diphasiastrum complanatum TaxID=34168 RepID=A0ACC2AKK9_DIPCM|nr:hypothetical protein O6H91_Y229800 [Diphasiastrum complanatum]KAJ7517652.1 hypothetical protein O6H91_21G033200 [Diphasiastrum complanatum]
MASQWIMVLSLLVMWVIPQGSLAADEDPLQDFCVKDTTQQIHVNGFPCKDPAQVQASEFVSTVVKNPGNTSNGLGVAVTAANALTFGGLNTLGVSLARIDFAKNGLNPPHVHPRATELLYLSQGTLVVGFVTSTPENKLFAQTITAGELFVFPRGLVHFQLSTGDGTALAFSSFNSQNQGTSQVAKALFTSSPPIDDTVLEKSLQLSAADVSRLRSLIKKT